MRDAIVEAMARAIARRNYPSATDRDIDMMWEGWVCDAQAALSALEAMGLALVPREPTEAMLEAANMADRGMMPWAQQYRAMLAASPMRGEG